MEKTENKDNSNIEVTPDDVQKALETMFPFFQSPCKRCSHKEVCKNVDIYEEEYIKTNEFCKYFIDAIGYQTYSSIYDMFLPIFDWLKYHYPSGEARFIVERDKAQMVLEHGVCAFSKEIKTPIKTKENK